VVKCRRRRVPQKVPNKCLQLSANCSPVRRSSTLPRMDAGRSGIPLLGPLLHPPTRCDGGMASLALHGRYFPRLGNSLGGRCHGVDFECAGVSGSSTMGDLALVAIASPPAFMVRFGNGRHLANTDNCSKELLGAAWANERHHQACVIGRHSVAEPMAASCSIERKLGKEGGSVFHLESDAQGWRSHRLGSHAHIRRPLKKALFERSRQQPTCTHKSCPAAPSRDRIGRVAHLSEALLLPSHPPRLVAPPKCQSFSSENPITSLRG
jgi:hypothetical protein